MITSPIAMSPGVDLLRVAAPKEARHVRMREWGRPGDHDVDASLPQPSEMELQPFKACAKIRSTLGADFARALERQMTSLAYDNASIYVSELVRQETRILSATGQCSVALTDEFEAIKSGSRRYGAAIPPEEITLSMTPKIAYWFSALMNQVQLPRMHSVRSIAPIPKSSILVRALIAAEDRKPSYLFRARASGVIGVRTRF